MAARVAILALCVCVCVCVTITRALQPAARIYIDVPKRQPAIDADDTTDMNVLDDYRNEDIEKRYTDELLEDLKNTKTDVLLLYTEYTSQAAIDLSLFLKNVSQLTQDTIRSMENRVLDRASRLCRDEFEKNMKKISYNAQRAASFSGENHHKYFLGHMIVFRMHLNRSEDYIRKCEKVWNGCGINCETTPRMIRWRKLALHELNRVKDDIQHSRRSYRDLLLHSRRKMKRLRKDAQVRAKSAVEAVERCVCSTAC